MARKKRESEQRFGRAVVDGKVPDDIVRLVVDKEYSKNRLNHIIAGACLILAVLSAFFHIDGGDVDLTLKGFGAVNGGFAVAFLLIAGFALGKTNDPDMTVRGTPPPAARTSSSGNKGGKKSSSDSKS